MSSAQSPAQSSKSASGSAPRFAPPSSGPVLVIGETLIDQVHRPDDGDREPAAHPGGFGANVAIGLARLECPVRLATRFGDDEYGRMLADNLAANGVTTLDDSQKAGAVTSVAAATIGVTGGATYEFELDGDLPALRLPDDATAVHTGSLSTVVEPGASAVEAFLRSLADAPITICYDPNCRPNATPDGAALRERVRTLATLADVIKISDEDCAFLAPGEDPAAVAAELLGGRSRWAIVTMGNQGAVVVGPAGTHRVRTPQIEVVDTVGAGDSFTAALLTSLHGRGLLGATRLDGFADALDDVVGLACEAAAITCTRAGADPPWAAELTV